jgi:choline dehydrogenase
MGDGVRGTRGDLCAGSIGTPQILQLSGIGPADLLRGHGIDVIVDAPGVGANLQDHLQIRAVYKITGAKTLNVLASSLYGKTKIGLEYLLKRSGPMSMAPSQLGTFTRSSPERPWPNLQYHVQPLSLDAFGELLHAFSAITASVCNLNPTSRGTVRIKTPFFENPPAIVPNYLSTDEDRKAAVESLRVTRRIVAQPALSRGSDSDPMAVLDTRLRVRGVENVRVVDAGAMPTITNGNTNSPTLMMAEKAAGWIRREV